MKQVFFDYILLPLWVGIMVVSFTLVTHEPLWLILVAANSILFWFVVMGGKWV